MGNNNQNKPLLEIFTMWCRIKDIDPSYRQFLTQKQIQNLGLSSNPQPIPDNENSGNRSPIDPEKRFTADSCDEDTIILVIPPYEDLQSELPDHYHNPHRLP